VTVDGRVLGIHAIDAMAGIGKTTFAVHTKRRQLHRSSRSERVACRACETAVAEHA
jgi:hypothetical protein